MIRIGINGFGRIGRNVVRALYEAGMAGKEFPIQVAAINDIGSNEAMAHLLRYDTVHGVFCVPTKLQGKQWLRIGGDAIPLMNYADPAEIPWESLGIDVVLECTGQFRAYADASRHLEAGAKRVILGSVPFDDADAVVVYGVNHDAALDARIISAASCTTHCLAMLLSVMDAAFGVNTAMMTEIHAYTSDQQILDHVHRDLRRARAGAQNLIPTTSSSIGAIQKVMPQLTGRISGYSMRVPTVNVAAIDLTLMLERTPEVDDINAIMKLASDEPLAGLLGYCREPLVSSDFIHETPSAIYDATQTVVNNGLVKIVGWYDNEWGYANRLLDLLAWMDANPAAS